MIVRIHLPIKIHHPLILLSFASSMPVYAQYTKIVSPDSIKQHIQLNEEAIKMIRFDFAPQNREKKTGEPLDAPIDKKWMKFKEDLSLPRSFTDTTKVKKPKGYIRAEPYTIWTKFGENPVYDVLPNIEKRWEIHWTLNPFKDIQEDYGRTLKPSTGKMYSSLHSSIGPSVILNVDIDKFLYENLSKRGRAIKHNRKYAIAWKTYKDFRPTDIDKAKFPTYALTNADTTALLPADTLRADTVHSADSIPKAIPIPHVDSTESRFEQLIQQKRKEAKQEKEKKKQTKQKNAYDIGKEIRQLKEQSK